ncbi:MAG: ABC transporter substrate-binding protein [Finegoldia sp.]|nr:ABC transporter substrate-binding protein [Finegoldia sp.]
MKSKKILAMLTAAMLALTGCAAGGNEANLENSDTVKLGLITPQTGPVSNYGNSTEKGIDLAIKEINAAGGISGKQVEKIAYDDKGDITDAVNAYNRLMQDGVNAIIGAITSKPTLAVAESALNDGIPMVTPTGTQANITEGKENVFRTCFTDPYQGELLAIFAKDNLNATKAAILTNSSSDYSTGISQAFKDKASELGIEIVAEESYGENDTDFKAQLTKINSSNPDVLLIPDYYEKIALIAPQARQSGIKAPFLGGDGWDGSIQVMDQSNLKDIEGSYFTNHFSLDDKAENIQKFIADYQKEYGEDPTAFSALGYDTVYLMKEAMEKSSGGDYKAIVDSLKASDFKGITGAFKFNESNNPVKTASIIKIDNGEYKFETTVSPR